MDLTQLETHSTPWYPICSTTNSTSNDTIIMCYLQNQREIIHTAFYVVSFCVFLVSTFVLLAFSERGVKLSKGTENCILFFCFIVTIVADLSYEMERDRVIFNIYTAVILLFFGIITFVYGSFKLFDAAHLTETLGHHHEGIGFILWSIAIPLIVFEAMIFISQILNPNPTSALADIISSLQMAIQAGVYNYSLRYQRPAEGKEHGASLFFKIAALVNFSMWLQSIMNPECEKHFEILFDTNSKPMSILASTYSALVIDYRLLCCLLFLEHALDIGNDDEGKQLCPPTPKPSKNVNNHFFLSTNRFTGMGWCVGLFISVLSLVNGTQYLTSIGSWSDLFSYFIQLTVVFMGLYMLKQIPRVRGDQTHWRESSSAGVDVMVALMGVFSMAFWLLKGFIITIWYIKVPREILDDQLVLFRTNASYLIWQGIKCFVRAICIVFQIIFFMKINSSIGRVQNIFMNRWNHFVLPVIIAGLFSNFINSLIDSYSGFVEDNVRKSEFCSVVSILYNSGMPIHLGFCIHLFLHFLIIYKRMGNVIEGLQINSEATQDLLEI